jgi:hypothetical protein
MARMYAQQKNAPAGYSKRLSSKAATSEGGVESLNEERTPLTDCFRVLLDDDETHEDLFVDFSHFISRSTREAKRSIILIGEIH